VQICRVLGCNFEKSLFRRVIELHFNNFHYCGENKLFSESRTNNCKKGDLPLFVQMNIYFVANLKPHFSLDVFFWFGLGFMGFIGFQASRFLGPDPVGQL